MRKHESAIADIQLLVIQEQISAILEYANNHARNKNGDISYVLERITSRITRRTKSI